MTSCGTPRLPSGSAAEVEAPDPVRAWTIGTAGDTGTGSDLSVVPGSASTLISPPTSRIGTDILSRRETDWKAMRGVSLYGSWVSHESDGVAMPDQ